MCLKWLWCFQYPISYRDGCTAHASRKSCQKAVGSVNNLWNLHKIWVSFFWFFFFFFAFQRAKSLVLQRDISRLFLHQFCLMLCFLSLFTWTLCHPRAVDSLVKYFGLINFTIKFRSNGWISKYQRCIIGLSDWNWDFDNLPTNHLTAWRKNESLWRNDIDWRKYLLFPDEK